MPSGTNREVHSCCDDSAAFWLKAHEFAMFCGDCTWRPKGLRSLWRQHKCCGVKRCRCLSDLNPSETLDPTPVNPKPINTWVNLQSRGSCLCPQDIVRRPYKEGPSLNPQKRRQNSNLESDPLGLQSPFRGPRYPGLGAGGLKSCSERRFHEFLCCMGCLGFGFRGS